MVREIVRLMLIAVALAAVLPVGNATHGDGNAGRSLLFEGQIEWKPHDDVPGDDIGGAGWYDPNDRSAICVIRLFNVVFGGAFYYETLRLTTNAANIHVVHVPQTGIDAPPPDCPPAPIGNPAASLDQFIGTSAFNVWVSGTVQQSHVLCVETFATCTPKPSTAAWWMQNCDNPAPNNVDFNDGALSGLAPLGSSGLADTACTGNTYDFKGYLSDHLGNQTSSPSPHVDQVVPLMNGTTYAMSCYKIEYDRTPASPPFTTTSEDAESHDYFLVLDYSDASTAWAPAMLAHLEGPGGLPVHPGLTGSLALAGLFDLNGDNGFRCDGPAIQPPDKNKPAP